MALMVILMPLKGDWAIPQTGRNLSAARDYQTAFEVLQDKLMPEVERIWEQSLRFDNPQRQRMYLSNMLFDLLSIYGGDAKSLALSYLDYLRDGVELPTWAEAVPVLKQVDAAVGMALSNRDTSALLQGSMQRLLMNSYRDTVMGSAVLAGRRFARVAEPGACSFCLMLASRGAVYMSREKATFVGAVGITKHYSDGRSNGERVKKGRVRGSRPRDSKFHDHCRCHVVEVADSSELPPSSAWLEKAWADATGDVDGMKEKQAAWSDWLKENPLPWEPKRAA